MTKSRAVLWIKALTGVLAAMCAVFTVYVLLFAHIDLTAVRTGPLVAYGGAVIILGGLLLLLELPLLLYILLRRPGVKLQAALIVCLGAVLFVGCIVVTEKYTESRLPPRQSTITPSSQSPSSAR